MSKDELIAKQALRLEEQNEKNERNKDILKTLNYRFTSMGQPLNDNVIGMNTEQLAWCYQVKELIESIEL